MKTIKQQQEDKLRNAQVTSLMLGCILAIVSFIAGAVTSSEVIKHNLMFVIGFAELVVIFSLVSIFFNRNK
jgi:cation transporter-like permease